MPEPLTVVESVAWGPCNPKRIRVDNELLNFAATRHLCSDKDEAEEIYDMPGVEYVVRTVVYIEYKRKRES